MGPHLLSRPNSGCCFQNSAIEIRRATNCRTGYFFVCLFVLSDKCTILWGKIFGFVFISIDSTGHQLFLFQ